GILGVVQVDIGGGNRGDRVLQDGLGSLESSIVVDEDLGDAIVVLGVPRVSDLLVERRNRHRRSLLIVVRPFDGSGAEVLYRIGLWSESPEVIVGVDGIVHS